MFESVGQVLFSLLSCCLVAQTTLRIQKAWTISRPLRGPADWKGNLSRSRIGPIRLYMSRNWSTECQGQMAASAALWRETDRAFGGSHVDSYINRGRAWRRDKREAGRGPALVPSSPFLLSPPSPPPVLPCLPAHRHHELFLHLINLPFCSSRFERLLFLSPHFLFPQHSPGYRQQSLCPPIAGAGEWEST